MSATSSSTSSSLSSSARTSSSDNGFKQKQEKNEGKNQKYDSRGKYSTFWIKWNWIVWLTMVLNNGGDITRKHAEKILMLVARNCGRTCRKGLHVSIDMQRK